MKIVNGIEVFLSKDLSIVKNGITPIEAMLLTAEHHRNAGGKVIDPEFADKNATDIKDPVMDADGKQAMTKAEPVMKDGKPVTENGKPVMTESVPAFQDRTEEQELARLRVRYGSNKVKALLSEVREFPKDFKTATARGVQIVMPTSPLTQVKLV